MSDRALPPEHETLHLTPAELEQITSGRTDDVDARRLDHLEHCARCREQLTRTAAEPSFWNQSSDLLRSVTFNSWDSGAPEPAGDSPGTDEATELVVRSLLAPTEQDGSLGRLGRFEVLGIVGSGGMGIVLKCRDVDIDRVVAIKIPSAQLWRCRAALATLEREARSAASVVHPHVIAIYQVDRWRDVPYLVMPYFPGPSLDRRIGRSGPLPLAEAIRIARQTAEALAAAHARGVIHRDVKPGNILLGRGTERAVLSDFGLAKVHSDATLTASGLLAGTPSYLSPEQARGLRVGPASDLFSLGSVLWTMLSGRVPWAGLHPHAIIHRIAAGELPPFDAPNDDVPQWALRLVEWMHRVDPGERPQSASEVAALLEACERHLNDPEEHPLPVELETDDVSHRPHRRWLAASAAAALLILILLAPPLLWFSSSREAPADATPAQPANAPAIPQAKSDGAAAATGGASDGGDEPAPQESSPEAIDAMLDEVEASTQQILSELQALQEAKP